MELAAVASGYSTSIFVCLLSWQELAASEEVAPYICGVAVADGPVFPGNTWRGTMMVDEYLCPNPQYSVVSMLSE